MSKQIIETVINKYNEFKNTKYTAIVSEAVDKCFEDKCDEALEIVNSLPKRMLADLVEKIRGKSIETGIKDLLNGKIDNTIDNLKVLSSLKTHCLIEMKTSPEFKTLLEMIETKYQEVRSKI